MGLINYEAKEIMLEKIKTASSLSREEIDLRAEMRKDFVTMFSNTKIRNLTPEDYFPGLGKKEDCLGYQLEWGTRPLGSIKGGSMAKYGPKEQFEEIKKLFIDLTSLNDDIFEFYKEDGSFTKNSKSLISQSQNIRGMKSGRTVLGKMLSIYYPRIFVPIFTEQDYLLENIIQNYYEQYYKDVVGLELYMENNYLFLQIKKELSEEPMFLKYFNKAECTNDVFYKFLYQCFPRELGLKIKVDVAEKEDEKIEALETEHYQKLIHRNFSKLFRNLTYFDEEVQNQHEGHYATEDVGVMDFLCLDDKDNIVVIELKRRGTDKTLGQLCRYMGWTKENLAKESQKVYGLIVSESKDKVLEYAIKVVPNVNIKHMKLDVTIEDF